MIPKRISFSPTLMLEEAIRFYADFKDATVKIQAMLSWISPESGNHTDNLLKLQQKLISKKTCDKLFMKVDVSYHLDLNNNMHVYVSMK